MSEAERVIAAALGEVGYREKASNADLDSLAANAGSGNWTKYARDLAAAGYYNANKNGYEWCDVFADWCFFKAFGSGQRAQEVQCQTGPYGAGVEFSARYYKAQGRYDQTPRLGDQVFFQQNGELVHTGIVTAVSADEITTVEGNAADGVRQRVHRRDDSYIAGYGHPKYEGGESPSVPASSVRPAEQTGAEVAVTLNTLKTGSKSPQVRTVQRLLNAAGFTDAGGKVLAEDGKFGAGTKAAVVKAQNALFPDEPAQWDGQVGQRTWSGLLREL